MAFAMIGAWEWGGLARLRWPARALYALALGALGVGISVSAHAAIAKSIAYGAGALFWLALAPLWLWERPTFGTPAIPLLAGVLAIVPALAAAVDLRDAQPSLLAAILGLVWISDSFAYLAGVRFGRHKLAAAISPKKTWEGLYGALAAVAVYAVAWLAIAWESQPAAFKRAALGPMWFVLALLLLALAGVLGDLLESQMKREAGVKDSGALLPGHGGVLDRIDALLPVLPLAALLFLQ
ncbi:MAG: phosphatidate cytidylyltransferase [Betaproteobacteria bacterium]|nr:phosphatidate cytidylyltransferase [Betaproteobacteria bacterium]